MLTWAPSSLASTREPLREAFTAPSLPGGAEFEARPSSRALRALESSRRQVEAGEEGAQISSSAYGPEQMAEVASVLGGLVHGPELDRLSVYLATPTELEQVCGATVVACYSPSRREMFVAGEDRSVAGVSREFAIAHEYGHHIANSQRGDLLAPMQGGTIRWATHERVCQLTRAGKLYPGDQDAHYWENPEEAFAQSYAYLNNPTRMPWQYASFLRPTLQSFLEIRADVLSPWQGPTKEVWSGITDASRSASRILRTELDGMVSANLEAPSGDALSIGLRDPFSRQVLARSDAKEGGGAAIAFANCGRRELLLEVLGPEPSSPFRMMVASP